MKKETKPQKQTLHEIAALYLFEHGPRRACDIQRHMYRTKWGSEMPPGTNWYSSYFTNPFGFSKSRYALSMTYDNAHTALWERDDDMGWSLTVHGIDFVNGLVVNKGKKTEAKKDMKKMATKKVTKVPAKKVSLMGVSGHKTFYIRPERAAHPVSCVVYQLVTDPLGEVYKLRVGHSTHNPCDAFSKKDARLVAAGRLLLDPVEIPFNVFDGLTYEGAIKAYFVDNPPNNRMKRAIEAWMSEW